MPRWRTRRRLLHGRRATACANAGCEWACPQSCHPIPFLWFPSDASWWMLDLPSPRGNRQHVHFSSAERPTPDQGTLHPEGMQCRQPGEPCPGWSHVAPGAWTGSRRHMRRDGTGGSLGPARPGSDHQPSHAGLVREEIARSRPVDVRPVEVPGGTSDPETRRPRRSSGGRRRTGGRRVPSFTLQTSSATPDLTLNPTMMTFGPLFTSARRQTLSALTVPPRHHDSVRAIAMMTVTGARGWPSGEQPHDRERDHPRAGQPAELRVDHLRSFRRGPGRSGPRSAGSSARRSTSQSDVRPGTGRVRARTLTRTSPGTSRGSRRCGRRSGTVRRRPILRATARSKTSPRSSLFWCARRTDLAPCAHEEVPRLIRPVGSMIRVGAATCLRGPGGR